MKKLGEVKESNWVSDYWCYTTDVIEEKTDEPIGNFTGLFDSRGYPLFRSKERIGFKIWKS